MAHSTKRTTPTGITRHTNQSDRASTSAETGVTARSSRRPSRQTMGSRNRSFMPPVKRTARARSSVTTTTQPTGMPTAHAMPYSDGCAIPSGKASGLKYGSAYVKRPSDPATARSQMCHSSPQRAAIGVRFLRHETTPRRVTRVSETIASGSFHAIGGGGTVSVAPPASPRLMPSPSSVTLALSFFRAYVPCVSSGCR